LGEKPDPNGAFKAAFVDGHAKPIAHAELQAFVPNSLDGGRAWPMLTTEGGVSGLDFR